MESNENIQKDNKKKPSRRKYIIAAGFILLIGIFVLLFHIWEPKYDPASEAVIHEAAAEILKKDPNELTDDDFAKITAMKLQGEILADIKLLEKFTNLQELSIIYTPRPLNTIPSK